MIFQALLKDIDDGQRLDPRETDKRLLELASQEGSSIVVNTHLKHGEVTGHSFHRDGFAITTNFGEGDVEGSVASMDLAGRELLPEGKSRKYLGVLNGLTRR